MKRHHRLPGGQDPGDLPRAVHLRPLEGPREFRDPEGVLPDQEREGDSLDPRFADRGFGGGNGNLEEVERPRPVHRHLPAAHPPAGLELPDGKSRPGRRKDRKRQIGRGNAREEDVSAPRAPEGGGEAQISGGGALPEPQPCRRPSEQSGPLPRGDDLVQGDGRVPGEGEGHSREAESRREDETRLLRRQVDAVLPQHGPEGRQDRVRRKREGDRGAERGQEQERADRDDRAAPEPPRDPFSGQMPSGPLSGAQGARRGAGARRRPGSFPLRRDAGRRSSSTRTVSSGRGARRCW